MAEQFTRNEQVVSSILTISSRKPQCLAVWQALGFDFFQFYGCADYVPLTQNAMNLNKRQFS